VILLDSYLKKSSYINFHYKVYMAAIECKVAMCIVRLVEFELPLELKYEQKNCTSLDSLWYKDASKGKQSVRGQSVRPSQLYGENFIH
jgi:hypothetical protein